MLKTESSMPQIAGYYSQWQKLNIDASSWQNGGSQLKHEGRRIISEYVKATSKSILDVGCGIGLDYDYYKESIVRYHGVDVTPKFVEEARRRGVPATVANVLHLNFPDNNMDTVYCKDLLIHLEPGDWRRVLKEMARVAKIQVITLEDNWDAVTIYALREKHAYVNPEKNIFRPLYFYHNVYSKGDFFGFAASLGLTVHEKHVPYPCAEPIGVQLQGSRDHTSQITVYRKDDGEVNWPQ